MNWNTNLVLTIFLLCLFLAQQSISAAPLSRPPEGCVEYDPDVLRAGERGGSAVLLLPPQADRGSRLLLLNGQESVKEVLSRLGHTDDPFFFPFSFFPLSLSLFLASLFLSSQSH